MKPESCITGRLPFEPPGKSLKRQGSSQTREENPPFSSGVPVAPSTDKTYITFNVKKKSLGSSPLWQFSSVTQSSRTLCDPMDCSTPGFPVHHQLPELAQTHVHRVRDAIQPTLPLSTPSPPSIFPSITVFSNESILRIRCPNYGRVGSEEFICSEGVIH